MVCLNSIPSAHPDLKRELERVVPIVISGWCIQIILMVRAGGVGVASIVVDAADSCQRAVFNVVVGIYLEPDRAIRRIRGVVAGQLDNCGTVYGDPFPAVFRVPFFLRGHSKGKHVILGIKFAIIIIGIVSPAPGCPQTLMSRSDW